MKYIIQNTEDTSGKPIDIGVIEMEGNEALKVHFSLWGSMVYDNEIVPFFSRMATKIFHRSETLSEKTTEDKDSKDEKIIPGETHESLFRNFSIFFLEILAWLLNMCGVRMIPFSGDGFWMRDPEKHRCVVSDVSSDTDFVSVMSPEIFMSWKKNGGKKLDWFEIRIGDRKKRDALPGVHR